MQYPNFVKNDFFYSLDHSKTKEEQLTALAENIKKVHSLASQHYNSFETLIAAYLKSGIEIFDMQTGIVSHIVDDTQYIVKDVVTDLEVIHPGDVFELEGTYCREVYKTQQTLGFPQVGKIKELQQHPVYVNLKLEAYISAPIYVRDTIYGTLNFTSLQPREHGFSEHEHDLISMMAQAIGNFILLQEKENNLKHLNFRMKELVGHVAHDLRNPIGAIKSLAELSLSGNKDKEKILTFVQTMQEESERSLELINSILAEAALGTGKVMMKKEYAPLSPILEKVLNSLNELKEQKRLSLKVSKTDDMNVYVDTKRIRQVLENLLSNAYKYARANSSIEIKFTKKEDLIICDITNEKALQESDLDASLYKSIGYGMNIIEEILKQHESKLKVLENENSYKVSFNLPIKES